MRSYVGRLGSFFVLLLVLLTFSAGQAGAAGTASVSTFYKDKIQSPDNAFLYTGPSGTVYQVITDAHTVNAISATGKKLWSYTFPKESNITLDSEQKYSVTEEKGNFYISYLDSSSAKTTGEYLVSFNSKGKINWKVKLPGTNWGTGTGKLLFDTDGTIYFGTGNFTHESGPFLQTRFYAVTPKGQIKWSLNLKGDGYYATPFLDGNGYIDITTDGGESAVANVINKKGRLTSSKTTNAFYHYTDKAHNVYMLDFTKNKVIAQNKAGKQLWSYNTAGQIEYVDPNGTVYVSTDTGSKNGYVLAIANGKLKWKTKVPGDISPYNAGLIAVFNDYDWSKNTGQMLINVLDVKTGKIKSSKTINASYFTYNVNSKGTVLVSNGTTIYKAN